MRDKFKDLLHTRGVNVSDLFFASGYVVGERRNRARRSESIAVALGKIKFHRFPWSGGKGRLKRFQRMKSGNKSFCDERIARVKVFVEPTDSKVGLFHDVSDAYSIKSEFSKASGGDFYNALVSGQLVGLRMAHLSFPYKSVTYYILGFMEMILKATCRHMKPRRAHGHT
jgi:hypothetical protein